MVICIVNAPVYSIMVLMIKLFIIRIKTKNQTMNQFRIINCTVSREKILLFKCSINCFENVFKA